MVHDMTYAGPSMNPTLKAGDGLTVISYGNRKIRIGDVVVFPHPEVGNNVVHRVVAVGSRGVRTRGDNNINIDPWVLHSEDIVGRVVSAQRKSRRLPIHSGATGVIIVFALWPITKILVTVSRILHPVYHRFAGSGIFKRYMRFLPKTRVLSFNKSIGTELQLLLGNRVIGRRVPGSHKWQIVRPFRLFVDETSLPK
jgi:signal peptidase I